MHLSFACARARALRLSLLAWASLTLVGCAALHVEDPHFTDGPGSQDPDSDGGLGPAPDGGPGNSLPTVHITKPVEGANVPAGMLHIEGEAADDQGVAAVLVSVGPNVALLAKSGDNFKHWTVDSPVPAGMFVVSARARDDAGQLGEPDRIALMGPTTASDDATPTLVITSPPDKSAPLHALVLVSGTASDDRAVVSMDMYRNGELRKDWPVESDDFFAHWSRQVPLIPGIDNKLEFVARDAAGHEARATITLFGRAEIDREPPKLVVTAPADKSTFASDKLTVKGTADDNVGIREVKMRIGTMPSGTTTLSWTEYAQSETQDGYANWTHTLTVPAGALSLEVRAIDLNGLASSQTLSLTNSFVPVWSDEVSIPLRLRDATQPQLTFELDQPGVNDVIAADIQKDTKLLDLDSAPLLTSAVNDIKLSCGDSWKADSDDPKHNCDLTDLGKTYGDAQGVPWQQSAEFSLVRLLTMTPRNAVVDGTSIANLKSIANSLNVGGGFHEILADTLGISTTTEIVSTGAVVKALQNYWMASHPAVGANATLPITLYDAMNNLGPLKDRFGPSGGHPGLLDPSFTPYSKVFGDDFKLILGAQSNLQWMDGVDLSDKNAETNKDYLALVIDHQGPTYDDVLEFDFTDPAKFDVKGLVAKPTVDLRMSMKENTSWVNSCLPSKGGDAGCKANLPNAPLAGYLWSIPRYQVEVLVGGAAYEQYKTRANVSNSYPILLGIITAATVTVGKNNPPGWSTYQTFLGIGSPPENQYLWELILEVGQRALHNFSGITLAEGKANTAFTLYGIDVGLTADQIRTAMRPELQKQRHKLSDKLLGDYQKNNGAVDFYYRRGDDGKPYLYFVAASDPLPDATYQYTQPGFFADDALTTKLSSTAAGTSGDSAHEKLSLPSGESTVFVKDETNTIYRLRFVVEDTSEIRVFASRKVR